MSLFGDAVLSLLGLVFGDDGAAEILDFYEDAYAEMAVAVFPYIEDVIVPEIRRSAEAMRQQAASRYNIRAGPSSRTMTALFEKLPRRISHGGKRYRLRLTLRICPQGAGHPHRSGCTRRRPRPLDDILPCAPRRLSFAGRAGRAAAADFR